MEFKRSGVQALRAQLSMSLLPSGHFPQGKVVLPLDFHCSGSTNLTEQKNSLGKKKILQDG